MKNGFSCDEIEDVIEYNKETVEARNEPFDEVRIRYQNWYHRKCVWYIAHLIKLDNFF